MVDLPGDFATFFPQTGSNCRKAFRRIDEQILHPRGFRCFSANARPGTTFASGSLLTLKTKHFAFHKKRSFRTQIFSMDNHKCIIQEARTMGCNICYNRKIFSGDSAFEEADFQPPFCMCGSERG